MANLMVQEGFLQEASKKKKKIGNSNHLFLDLRLKYNDQKPSFEGLRLISAPSRHVYSKAKDLKPVRSGDGFSIV